MRDVGESPLNIKSNLLPKVKTEDCSVQHCFNRITDFIMMNCDNVFLSINEKNNFLDHFLFSVSEISGQHCQPKCHFSSFHKKT